MAAKKKQVDFEKGLASLEALLTRMEGGLPLEEAMAAYEEGIKLYTELSAQLDSSEKRLKTLSAAQEEA